MRELLAKTGHELIELMDAGELDHRELQEAQFEFAREIDDKLNSFISWDEDVESQSWPLEIKQGGKRHFQRLPYAAKDIFTTKGLATTAGSKILQDYKPPYDATAISLLRHEKNHLMGKTNLDEFAMGSSGEMSAYGRTSNPWGLEYVPGGSSSGSASAVAACQAVMALGTDTGGSVRQPASFCGVVGYKPTYSLVSRNGMVAYASSCDQCGVFARDTLDVALTMNTVSQPDPLDSTCTADGEVDYAAEAEREMHWNQLRVGVLKPFVAKDRIDKPVLDNFKASLKHLSSAGAEIVELDFDQADYCLPAYYIITAAECSSNLARYDGFRYGAAAEGGDLMEQYIKVRSDGFGDEVKRRILLGTYVLSAGYFDAYYDRARQMRRVIRNSFDEMFSKVHVIATPTSPTLPFKHGERLGDPIRMYMSDLCTIYVNLVGTAGISLPNGFGDADGASLPTGIQFICAPFRDQLLLRVAAQFEQLVGYRYRPPAWVAEALGV